MPTVYQRKSVYPRVARNSIPFKDLVSITQEKTITKQSDPRLSKRFWTLTVKVENLSMTTLANPNTNQLVGNKYLPELI